MSTENRANFIVQGTTRASVHEAWNLVTDWPAQTRWIAFTNVAIVTPTDGVGTRFTGRTGVGPIWFDDPMEVVTWEPPTSIDRGYCKVQKFGPWILGTAEIIVEPAENELNGATVTWRESIRLRGVSPLFNPLVRGMGGILFRATMRSAIAELNATHASSHGLTQAD